MDDGDEGAVQVAQVLRQQRLAVTAGQVTHLQRRKRRRRSEKEELLVVLLGEGSISTI